MWRQVLVIVVVIVSVTLEGMNPAIAHRVQHSSPQFIQFATFAKAMNAGMEKMIADMHHAGMTGNADVDFLTMMWNHHEGAVEMARLLLLYGKDPLVRNLAEEIIASQQVEITAMRDRLPILQQGENLDPDDFPALTGIRGTVIPKS